MWDVAAFRKHSVRDTLGKARMQDVVPCLQFGNTENVCSLELAVVGNRCVKRISCSLGSAVQKKVVGVTFILSGKQGGLHREDWIGAVVHTHVHGLFQTFY